MNEIGLGTRIKQFEPNWGGWALHRRATHPNWILFIAVGT